MTRIHQKSAPGLLVALLMILRLLGSIASDAADTVLVWLGLKFWPATGRARWRRSTRPDPRANAWQARIRPRTQQQAAPLSCLHQDAHGASWIVSTIDNRGGPPRNVRVCVQCERTWDDGHHKPTA